MLCRDRKDQFMNAFYPSQFRQIVDRFEPISWVCIGLDDKRGKLFVKVSEKHVLIIRWSRLVIQTTYSCRQYWFEWCGFLWTRWGCRRTGYPSMCFWDGDILFWDCLWPDTRDWEFRTSMTLGSALAALLPAGSTYETGWEIEELCSCRYNALTSQTPCLRSQPSSWPSYRYGPVN
jgi:hypothetical protein